MNVEALHQLRRVVLAAPENLFDMTTFTFVGSCGTVHCAAGWAAIDPWFNSRGFRFNENKSYPVLVTNDGEDILIVWNALENFFDLSQRDSNTLFGNGISSWEHVPKQLVIDNIDRVLRGEVPVSYDSI